MTETNAIPLSKSWAMRYIDEMVYDVERQIVVKL